MYPSVDRQKISKNISPNGRYFPIFNTKGLLAAFPFQLLPEGEVYDPSNANHHMRWEVPFGGAFDLTSAVFVGIAPSYGIEKAGVHTLASAEGVAIEVYKALFGENQPFIDAYRNVPSDRD